MLLDSLEEVSKKWFKKPPRPFIEHAVGEIQSKWDSRNFFVIEAPTGYGKSTISATLALNSLQGGFKCIIAFPLRTLLEDQFKKFERTSWRKAGVGGKKVYAQSRFAVSHKARNAHNGRHSRL
jgi:CRISPR-associated endonuclease/helicase Cas3